MADPLRVVGRQLWSIQLDDRRFNGIRDAGLPGVSRKSTTGDDRRSTGGACRVLDPVIERLDALARIEVEIAEGNGLAVVCAGRRSERELWGPIVRQIGITAH